MAISVKLFMTLVPLSKSKKSTLAVDWFDGITAQHILESEEFSEQDQEAIAVVINSVQAQVDDPLNDGDQVDLLVNLQGGSVDLLVNLQGGSIERESRGAASSQ